LIFTSKITLDHLEEVKRIVNGEFETYSYEDHPFKDRSFHELQDMLGLKLDSEVTKAHTPVGLENLSLPDNFDSRTQWPSCSGKIRNQARCGSCWAFGAAEAFSDRACIALGSFVDMSPQSLVSCDYDNMGCNGGWLDKTWNFLTSVGIVADSCWTYKSGDGSVPSCPDKSGHKVTKCEDGSAPVYFRSTSTLHPTTINAIKEEIQKNGPLETGFMVYQDFMSYKGGIYKHKSGGFMGGHAIKVLGWGVEEGVKYWIAANSWAETWGEKGFFRIAEGECQFESMFYGGVPFKVTEFNRLNFLE